MHYHDWQATSTSTLQYHDWKATYIQNCTTMSGRPLAHSTMHYHKWQALTYSTMHYKWQATWTFNTTLPRVAGHSHIQQSNKSIKPLCTINNGVCCDVPDDNLMSLVVVASKNPMGGLCLVVTFMSSFDGLKCKFQLWIRSRASIGKFQMSRVNSVLSILFPGQRWWLTMNTTEFYAHFLVYMTHY